jgi:alpha-mannosidase
MRIIFLIILAFLFNNKIFPQNTYLVNSDFVNGYEKKIEGTDFEYHSSIPVAKESMLIRATDGNSSMEWQTSEVPKKISKEYISFVWLAGIGSSPGLGSFDVYIDQKKKFTFWADGKDSWQLTSEDGSILSFSKDMTDQHGDKFGFMYLNVKSGTLKSGQKLNIKIVGGNFSRTTWYMTFKFPLKIGVQFKSFPALQKNNDKNDQLGIAGIFYVGKPATARVYLKNKLISKIPIKFGYNYERVNLPVVEKTTKMPYTVKIGDQKWTGELELKPFRKWTVNFVEHTHTDIGYTRSQTEILGEHLRYIDYALDYCDLTDSYPEDAKFRWTCEASWAVDQYLKCRPDVQINRLLERIKEGRIEVTGMYFNFDELPDESLLSASLTPFKEFDKYNIKVKTAMQNDVNGIAWSMVDFYNDLGVRYLNMGTHGHRALICFDKPTLFWWQAPSGKKMLAFRGEHYMLGNTVFKIQSKDFNVFEDELLTYLNDLENKGYKYDLISIQHSGFITDNSPPSTTASDLIRQWNEKYEFPKLRTAIVSSFFEEMESKYGSQFEIIKGAWPDWWTDGFGASAREVTAIRNAQVESASDNAALTMASVAHLKLPDKIDENVSEINTALLFYTEHTLGYHASVREPFHEKTMEQRAIKESYAWEALRRSKMLKEETMGLLQTMFKNEKNPNIFVFNTLNWQRDGIFTTYIDYQTIPRDKPYEIKDIDDKQIKTQITEKLSDGAYYSVWVENVPAFAYKKLIINTDIKDNSTESKTVPSLENSWYKITIDTINGVISSILDKSTMKDIVDQNSEWKFGQFIYERLNNRSQMESFKLDNYTRESLESVRFEGISSGEIWNSIKFKGKTKAANDDGYLYFEIRLFNTVKRIDLVYSIDKKMVTEPEGIYIAFPFKSENGQISFDVAGGELRAGIDQIKGSANDWNTIQNYARISGQNSQIVLCSNDMPLMQFGAINTGRYKAGAKPQSTHIYSWPMNNYWTTNFNPEQHGGISWTYTITSIDNENSYEAIKFSRSTKTPLLSRVIPGGGNQTNIAQQSFIKNWPDNVILINSNIEDKGKSVIIQLREIKGISCELDLIDGINDKKLKFEQVDPVGKIIINGSSRINPYESKFYRIYFNE